jgi:peptide/nickel transport system permease protein
VIGFILRRLVVGVIALFVGLSASFFFWGTQYPPLKGTPILHDYWVWVRGLPTGHSLTHGLLLSTGTGTSAFVSPGSAPILSIVVGPLARTLLLVAVTIVLVVVTAVVLACVAAAKRGSALDLGLRAGSYLTWAVPGFVLATVLQEGLGRLPGGWGLGWFPYIGWAGECPNGQGIDSHNFQCPSGGTGLTHVGLVLDHLALPAIALALGFIGLHARYLRSSLLDALAAPYVTVARGKGLTERTVLLRHALRNALVTFVPAVLSDFGALFGAAMVVDYIFSLGGLGQLFIGMLNLNADALVPIDTYQMQLILLFAGGLMLLASVLGETAVALLDPRARPT